MAMTATPVFVQTPRVSWGKVMTENTAMDGTGTQITVFTAGSNGSRIDKIKVKHEGTSIQTVLRFFINNGSDNSEAANNILWKEQTILEATAAADTALTEYEIDADLVLPAGYRLNVTVGTTIANNLHVTCEGGDY
jgi:hypothetical protein